MKNYTVYHLHTDYSNADGFSDSCSKFTEYIELAKKQGMKAIAFSEHGNDYDWIKKKQYCDKAGLKYIHGVEAYICQELSVNERAQHIGLYARNWDGVLELNKLISNATKKGTKEDNSDRHFYYNPRISLDELLGTSDNIIVTSACLASPLNKWDNKENQSYFRKLVLWMMKNKHRCFLEVQYHLHDEQIRYNKKLYAYSLQTGIPLIAGTDTHSSNNYKAQCRKILQKYKGSSYGDEDTFDLTWKTYDELVSCFEKQNALPKDVYLEAIENTNRFADMFEEYTLDRSFKYPTMYGDNAKSTWWKLICDCFDEKRINGKLRLPSIVKKKCEEYFNSSHNVEDEYDIKISSVYNNDYKWSKEHTDEEIIALYKSIIQEEYNVMCKLGMESFMMFMSEMISWANSNGIPCGTGRGSVCGSEIAYITNVTDVDPIVWNTVFSRFCNEDRISLGDVDVDFSGEDREKVYNYIIERFTPKKTAYIATFQTIQDRGCIDVLAGGLGYKDLNKVADIKNKFDEYLETYMKIVQEEVNIEELVENGEVDSGSITFDNCDVYASHISNDKHRKQLFSIKKQYDNLIRENQDLFYYFDGLKGTIVSKGVHASGIIGSPITLADNVGLFYKDGNSNMPVSSCAMKSIDSLNYVKFDILGLKTVGIIKDACEYAGISYPKSYELNWNDKKVWKNMIQSPQGVFQFESDYSFGLLSDFKPTTINHMSMVNASLRPSGKSYRDRLIAGEKNENPSEEIDKLLESNNGYLIFQEDTIKFLTDICGFSGSEADTTRRCVEENTYVLMPDCSKKIKDIKIGNYVICFDGNGNTAVKPVVNVFYNGVKRIKLIKTVVGYSLKATDNHPVFTQRGYVNVEDLSLNDYLMTPKKNYTMDDIKFPDYIPVKIESISDCGEAKVYDIEVADCHNFVANGLIVHNCIGKKDKEALMQQLPKILEGYCNTSSKPRHIAEEEAKQFVQIVQDSSEYQFGLNHSTAYSMNGYECVYLRTYYPLEFTAAYLNRADNKADIINGVALANQYGIEIYPIKFGKSGAKYMIDKQAFTIYKGIESIKYCNEKIANELLGISERKHETFTQVLDDIMDNTSVNTRQLKILTGLDFFSDYGKNKYLLRIIDIYLGVKDKSKTIIPSFKDCKVISKSKIESYADYGIYEYMIKECSGSETSKQYRAIDNERLIALIIKELKNEPMSLVEQVKFEKEYLEYVVYQNPDVNEKVYIVTEFTVGKNKFTPRVTLRNIKTGTDINTRVKQAKVYKDNPFGKYSVLIINEFEDSFKTKMINGEWTKTDEIEKVLKEYEVLND